MLSEEYLENLIAPILYRQEDINVYVIRKIAERIRKIGTLKSSDIQQLIRLRDVGGDVHKINIEIARLTNLQVKDIKNIIKFVALSNYLDAKPFYDYRHKPFIPFEKNVIVQRRIEAIARQTANTYINMSKSQAFMMRDPKNRKNLIPTSLSNYYQSIVDKAIQISQEGIVDYNTGMRNSLKELADSGYRRVWYESEKGRFHTQRMDSALRRNLLDGIRAINQGMQDIVGEQFGADGVEISVHLNPADDHAEMQGHQYTLQEFDNMQNGKDFIDIQGRHYKGFERAVGTLNCRHFAISIVIGYARQNYTDEQLKDILDKNNVGYTLPNGKHLTLYECTQYQRKLETKIRYAKEGQIAAREAGDIQLAQDYQRKINKYVTEYNSFNKACGLRGYPQKMSVPGYRKIKS